MPDWPLERLLFFCSFAVDSDSICLYLGVCCGRQFWCCVCFVLNFCGGMFHHISFGRCGSKWNWREIVDLNSIKYVIPAAVERVAKDALPSTTQGLGHIYLYEFPRSRSKATTKAKRAWEQHATISIYQIHFSVRESKNDLRDLLSRWTFWDWKLIHEFNLTILAFVQSF